MRARWIKPEFFRGRTMARLGPMAAVVFQALWCMADDGGVAMCDPARIKAEMFLFWEMVTVRAIDDALGALAAAECITMYTVGAEPYAEIVNWGKHQRVHLPSSFRHPRPNPESALSQPCVNAAAPLSQGSPPRHLDTQTPRCGLPERESDGEGPNEATAVHTDDDSFEVFWSLYPKRAGGANKPGARRCWDTRIGEGIAPAFLHDRARLYAAWIRASRKEGTDKVMMASTFLGRDRRYEDDFTIPPTLTLEHPSRGAEGDTSRVPYSREWLAKNGYPVPPIEGAA